MYSVVLMAALTGGAETPDFGFGRRCGCGHNGCGHCGFNGCGHRGHGCRHRDRCRGRCHGRCGHGGCWGGCHVSHGCHGGHGCHHGCGGGYVVPGPAPKKAEMNAPATIIVSLPAEAKLTIDGNPTTSTSARRVFTSPALEMGQEYIYTLRAEIIRDGETVAETQQVTVRAGAEIPVQFNMTSQGVATR